LIYSLEPQVTEAGNILACYSWLTHCLRQPEI